MSERILCTRCPLCDSQKITKTIIGDCSAHPLYKKALSRKIQWCQCADCQHAFTEGYYSEASCKIIFGETHENQKVGAPVEKNRVVSSKMVEKVLPSVFEGMWLDVGFGNGSLLFTAQEYGFKPVGLDLRSENVRALESLGIDAYCTDLTNLHLQDTCAVISMADVLEHMPYPKNGLVAANRLLQGDGVLFISMPNTENIVWKLMNENHQNPYWGELEHYHNFSRTRLYSLLAEHGFTPVRYGISERYRVCMEVVSLKAKTLATV